jgi:hypothetical protein
VAYDELKFDSSKHSVTVLALELSDLGGVKSFARQALQKLGADKLDYLLLNAAISNSAEKPWKQGSKWCEAYLVNHLCKRVLDRPSLASCHS